MTSPIGPRSASRYRRSRAATDVAPPPTWTAWSFVVANAGSSEMAQDDDGAWLRPIARISGASMIHPNPACILHHGQRMSLKGLVDPAQQEVLRQERRILG